MPWAFYDTYDKTDARLEVLFDSYKSADGTLYTRPGGVVQVMIVFSRELFR